MKFPEPIYGLSLVMNGDGDFAASKAADAQPVGFIPTVPGFLDAFRKTREPSPAEMVDEALSTAYACMILNADLVASTPLRLYVQTRPGEAATKLRRWDATKPVTKSAAARIKSDVPIARGAKEIEEVVSHPLLDLLDSPNPQMPSMTRYDMISLIVAYLDIVGRSYIYADSSGMGGRPAKLWILASQHVREVSSLGSANPIESYSYGGKQEYSLDEVTAFRRLDLKNPHSGGLSPLRSVIEHVRMMRKINAHTNALLDNAGRPDAVFTPKGSDDGYGIGASEAKRLEAAIRQRFAMAGRGGLLVLETPGSFSPMTWPTQDIIDIERERLTKTQVANAFGVPTTKLDRNDANRASATTGDYAHAKDAGVPRCKIVATGLTTLARRWDESGRLFFAFDSCVPDDRDADREDRKAMAAVGAISRNEWRELMGMDPRQDMDAPLVPSGMAAVDETGKPIPAQANAPFIMNLPGQPPVADQPVAPSPDPSATVGAPTLLNGAQLVAATQIVAQVTAGELPRDAGIGMLQVLFGLTGEQAETVMGSAGKPDVPTTPNQNPAVVPAQPPAGAPPPADNAKAIGRQWLPSLSLTKAAVTAGVPADAEVTRLAAACRKVFSDQLAEVLATMDSAKATKATDDVDPLLGLPRRFIDIATWNERLAFEVKPVIEVVARQAGKRILARVGASPEIYEVFDRNLPKAVEELSLRFAASTNETTSMELEQAREQLRQELSDGLIAGDTRVEMRRRVQDVFDNADKSRAETIARTETTRAVHTAEQMSAKESGVVSRKQWLLSADACPQCQAVPVAHPNGVPLDATFAELGGEYGSIDGPPLHPNCQCSLTYEIDESALQMPED